MTADFRFIMHAAESETRELAAGCAGDRFAKRRLADTRRADEAENRGLHLRDTALNRQVLKDTFLHLLETVVILVENLLRLRDIEETRVFLLQGSEISVSRYARTTVASADIGLI